MSEHCNNCQQLQHKKNLFVNNLRDRDEKLKRKNVKIRELLAEIKRLKKQNSEIAHDNLNLMSDNQAKEREIGQLQSKGT